MTYYSKIGIIREGKVPVDRRTPITPTAAKKAQLAHPELDLVVQKSPVRVFDDKEYEDARITLSDALLGRELIIGVKEVPVDMLIPDTSYLFFSHTIKKQPHNQKLLRAVLDKGITLLDHELLADAYGVRVLGFGRWAGIVGAYNALRGWQIVNGREQLRPAHTCHDRAEMEAELSKVHDVDLRIVITGKGRVGRGAVETLRKVGALELTPQEFLEDRSSGPYFTVLDTADLYERTDGKPFDKHAFHTDPTGHRSTLARFARKASVYIAGHFWDPRGPMILSADDLRDTDLSLHVIADISCDMNGPVASTLRASTIAEPFYGYDPATGNEVAVGTNGSILVMAVDNLPAELPRDASEQFADDLVVHVLPALLGKSNANMVENATIARNGKLTDRFAYLAGYAKGGIVV